MRKNVGDQIKFYRYTAIALAIVFLISTGFFFLQLWENKQNNFPTLDIGEPVIEYEGKTYELNENIQTFLVMGLDKFDGVSESDSYNNDKQADFLMLFVFDTELQTYSAIHINRDTMAEVNVLGVAGNPVDTVTKQIALAHTYGNGKEVSCRNVSDAVSALLLGMKVDHYISVTMDSVPLYNDLLGGVEVEILDDFTGIDDTLVKGQNVTLTGEQALTYVRTRYGLEDSTNSTRMERQRQYLNALQKKSVERFSTNDEFIIEATLKMADYIVSDRSVTQLQELLRKISTYEYTGIISMDGESKVGEKFIEFYPLQRSLEKIVVEKFYRPRD